MKRNGRTGCPSSPPCDPERAHWVMVILPIHAQPGGQGPRGLDNCHSPDCRRQSTDGCLGVPLSPLLQEWRSAWPQGSGETHFSRVSFLVFPAFRTIERPSYSRLAEALPALCSNHDSEPSTFVPCSGSLTSAPCLTLKWGNTRPTQKIQNHLYLPRLLTLSHLQNTFRHVDNPHKF